jgi:hypothetical protein
MRARSGARTLATRCRSFNFVCISQFRSLISTSHSNQSNQENPFSFLVMSISRPTFKAVSCTQLLTGQQPKLDAPPQHTVARLGEGNQEGFTAVVHAQGTNSPQPGDMSGIPAFHPHAHPATMHPAEKAAASKHLQVNAKPLMDAVCAAQAEMAPQSTLHACVGKVPSVKTRTKVPQTAYREPTSNCTLRVDKVGLQREALQEYWLAKQL